MTPETQHQRRGPKTRAGKARVRRNAIKHGLNCREIVVPEIGETLSDWQEHFIDTYRDLKPGGKLESDIVEQIAITTWRQRRGIRYESAAIRLQQSHADAAAFSALGDGIDAGPELFKELGVLPARNALLKLLRFESSQTNRLAVLVANLHRLQDRRKGTPRSGRYRRNGQNNFPKPLESVLAKRAAVLAGMN